jgi:hypothetical protein
MGLQRQLFKMVWQQQHFRAKSFSLSGLFWHSPIDTRREIEKVSNREHFSRSDHSFGSST